MLCELATGRRFWGDLTDADITRRLVLGDIPKPRDLNPTCVPELDRICSKALAFNLESRYQTIAEVQGDIEAFIDSHLSRITNQDLGRKLAEWFDRERKEALQLIEVSLSNATYLSCAGVPFASLNATSLFSKAASVTPPATVTETVLDIPTHSDHTPPTKTRSRHRYVKRLGQVVGAILVFGTGTLILRNQPHQPIATLSSAPVSPVAAQRALVRITAYPATATLSIDNDPISQNPFAKEYLIEDRWHLLRVQAPGHKTVEKRLQFTQNTELIISLQEEVAATPAATPALKSYSRARRVTHQSKPVTRARTACSPPYTYDQRGLKHFKTECL